MPPQGRRVVTIGVDLQDMELVGFGLSDESWSLDYRVLYGDPSGQELWGEPGVTRLVRERVQH